VQDSGVLKRYYEGTLRPLAEYDRVKGAQLLETLETYLSESCNLESTANRMFLHKNTLKYRLSKIESMTGSNLKAIDDRCQLYLALKIRNML
jgi:DNA-binding PucR family transcriptional regulator